LLNGKDLCKYQIQDISAHCLFQHCLLYCFCTWNSILKWTEKLHLNLHYAVHCVRFTLCLVYTYTVSVT